MPYCLIRAILLITLAHAINQVNCHLPDSHLVKFASKLDQSFARLARDEMGVLALQAAFDSLEYKQRSDSKVNSNSYKLSKLVESISRDLRGYVNAIVNSAPLARTLFRQHKKSSIAPRFDCCNLSKRDLKPDPVYNCRISTRKCCDLIPRALPPTAFNPGHNLTSRFAKLHDFWPNVKWVYFITGDGLHTEFPAHNFNPVDLTNPSSIPPSHPSLVKQPPTRSLHCQSLHQIRHRDIFVRSVIPRPIWTVLVVDQGESSQTQMLLGHRAAHLLISSLSVKDRLIVLTGSDRVAFINPGDGKTRALCDNGAPAFAPATDQVKQLLQQAITSVKSPLPVKTNHTLALLSAFDVFEKALLGQHNNSLLEQAEASQIHLFLAYISRGYLSDIQETANALGALTARQRRLRNQVVISTYMTVEEKSTTVLFERNFMHQLATRWDAYSTSPDSDLPKLKQGHFFAINRSLDLSETVGQFYRLFLPNQLASSSNDMSNPVQYSLPYNDLEGGGGLVLSISQAFFDQSHRLIGVMGIDVHARQLLDQLLLHSPTSTWQGGAGSSRAFIVASLSSTSSFLYTLAHPALTLTDIDASSADSSNHHHIDIARLERLPNFESMVKPEISSSLSGEKVLYLWLTRSEMESFDLIGPSDSLCSFNNTTTSERPHSNQLLHVRVVYRWHRITDPMTPFVVVVRAVEPACSSNVELVPIIPNFEFRYHRLDLLKPTYTCMYLRQLATFHFSTIYLAPRAFVNPLGRLQGNGQSVESLDDVRHLLAYLLDHTNLVSNPGLLSSSQQRQPDIRSSVGIVERIAKFWAHTARVGQSRNFIVRRYVATDSGVMLTFPGTLMPSSFDPTSRTWYKRALANPGLVVATGPYLDDGGAGPIITLSRTIFEGNSKGLHNPASDRVAAVIGVDVTYRFLSFALAQWLPICGKRLMVSLPLTNASQESNHSADNENIIQQRCFLMDDRGYLMAHPGFYVPRVAGPIEHSHANYHEPILFSDLLQHRDFVRKHACISYPHHNIHRYYSVNLTNTGPVTNAHLGDNCVTYKLMPVGRTNLFLGLIREHHRFGCSPRTAFCPCSTKSRQCLNCARRRLSEVECECPCQCRLSDANLSSQDNDDVCPNVHSSAPSEENLSSCPSLLDLNSVNPIPLASLKASIASLTNQPSAPPTCSRPDASDSSLPLDPGGGGANELSPSVSHFDLADSDSISRQHRHFKRQDSSSYQACSWPSQSTCAAAVGCEWCAVNATTKADNSGQQQVALDQPFCAPMAACYNGIVGAPSPYHIATSWSSSNGAGDDTFLASSLWAHQSQVDLDQFDNRPVLLSANLYFYPPVGRHQSKTHNQMIARLLTSQSKPDANTNPLHALTSSSTGPVVGMLLLGVGIIGILAAYLVHRGHDSNRCCCGPMIVRPCDRAGESDHHPNGGGAFNGSGFIGGSTTINIGSNVGLLANPSPHDPRRHSIARPAGSRRHSGIDDDENDREERFPAPQEPARSPSLNSLHANSSVTNNSRPDRNRNEHLSDSDDTTVRSLSTARSSSGVSSFVMPSSLRARLAFGRRLALLRASNCRPSPGSIQLLTEFAAPETPPVTVDSVPLLLSVGQTTPEQSLSEADRSSNPLEPVVDDGDRTALCENGDNKVELGVNPAVDRQVTDGEQSNSIDSVKEHMR